MDYFATFEEENLKQLKHYDKWSLFNGVLISIISGVAFGIGHGLATSLLNRKI